MRHGRARWLRCVVVQVMVIIASWAYAAAGSDDPGDIVREADAFRGFARPYRFVAEVERVDATALAADRREGVRVGARVTVVEVRSDGFDKQLILVREPRAGDVLLKIGDSIWLRPRQLHRLTRIPPGLRLFGGAAISDVVAVDLWRDYGAIVRPGSCENGAGLVLELTARRERSRYPRVEYWVGCENREPQRIDFMTAKGRVLKTIRYERFASVLGTRIGVELAIEDRVLRNVSIIRMSSFEFLPDSEPDLYTPAYLLSLARDLD